MKVRPLRRSGFALGCSFVLVCASAVVPRPEVFAGGNSPDAMESGRRLFVRHQCISCHRMGGEGYAEGVDLSHPTKLRPAWVREYLKSPNKYRQREMEMAMPGFALSEPEIDDLVAFLTKGSEESVPTTRPSADPERVQEGKLLFESYGCTACHRVGNEKFARVPAYYEAERQAAIVRQSPDLQYASRLNRAWAVDFMEKPGRYIPGTTMFNNGAGRSSLEKIFDYLTSVAPSSAGTVAKRDSR